MRFKSVQTIAGLCVFMTIGCASGNIDMPQVPTLMDEDGDGFAQEEDCNDFDASIHPNAPEQCDGIDNNCENGIDEGFKDLRIILITSDSVLPVFFSISSKVILSAQAAQITQSGLFMSGSEFLTLVIGV